MSRENRHPSFFSRPACGLWPLVLAALLGLPGQTAWGDDRDLLRESSGDPYLFILLDTSGSMNEKPETSTNAFSAADDPASKMYQAKEALYQVMSEFDNIFYGFATFNQDNLRVRRKHWIYQPQANPSWSATLGYPISGQNYIFGGAGDNSEYACGSPLTLPVSGSAFDTLVQNPRLGDDGAVTLGTWLKQGTRTYYVETRIKSAGGTLGDAALQIELRRRRLATGSGQCGGSPPGSSSFDETIGWTTVNYSLVTDALLRVPVGDVDAGGTCTGLDPNSDTGTGTTSPPSDGYKTSGPTVTINIKYPTTTNPSFPTNPRFDEGDFLPLNWTKTNQDEVLRRLAPNLRLGESVPDFREARYFQNTITGNTSGNYALQLLSSSVRPLLAEGNTPLGNSIEAFRTWYAGCAHGTCPKNTGWKDVAAGSDPNWPCRKKYLLVLTDGDETCSNGNGACSGTASLKAQEGVTTFVIAFGLPGGSNVLTCMAANGGSGKPVFPTDKTALLNELRNIFGAIKEQSRTFASAAVPGVQAEVQDKIYLTNFTPLNRNSYWDGHVEAFLKPLPLTTDGFPDNMRTCASGLISNCFVWDAGETIKALAPSTTDLAAATPNFHIGGGTTERRVFYTQAPTPGVVPNSRKLLLPQTGTTDKIDLWNGLGIPVPILTDTAAVNAADQKVVDVLKSTYKVKTDTVDTDTGSRTINYLLGDIFHSNPIVLSAPGRTLYFAGDLYNNGRSCDTATPPANPGYRCFAGKHVFRRKMLVVGANDQQLHVFDTGIFRGTQATGKFDNGTGYEIFSFVPRPVLPNLKVLSEDTTQHWGVDGTVQFDDVFIDPVHAGLPTESEREWRSVVVGGLREGGAGYFAVDLTQPDTLGSDRIPVPNNTWIPSCWNGGGGCGQVPFGTVLWTFTDARDEDLNGFSDLGDAWSNPNTGRILVKTTDVPPRFLDKFVAVFGGGMDPGKANRQGNWLYMVDIETGKAIYKRELDGSAASDPAAVDTDQDGYLDTVYIGTTAGFLYKADIRAAGTYALDATAGELRVTDTAWEPFKVFDTVMSDGRRGQIFYQPSVIFIPQNGKYALAFGTGNRESLWAKDGTPGRFYLVLDDNFQQGMTPRTESQYEDITVFSTAPTGSDFLIRPNTGKLAGWFLKLDADERMITKPFALAGITIFTSFDPRTDFTGGTGGGGGTPVCAQAGESNIFKVYTTNGDPIDPETGSFRWERKSDFVTSPFVESSTTKNKPNADGVEGEDICADKKEVAKRISALFPPNCQATTSAMNIETIQSGKNLVCIAPVTVCVVRKNWKEN